MDDNPPRGPIEFRKLLKENAADPIQAGAWETSQLWKKYRGMDGRTPPTHSIETGKRL
jgi:hypothetical protein